MTPTNWVRIQAYSIAVIDAIVSGLLIALYVFLMVFIAALKQPTAQEMEMLAEEIENFREEIKAQLGKSDSERTYALALPLACFVIQMGLNFNFLRNFVVLFHQSVQLNHKTLRIWLTITATLLGFGVLGFVVDVFRGAQADTFYITSIIVNVLFSLYSMWVVYALMLQIKAGGVAGKIHPGLKNLKTFM